MSNLSQDYVEQIERSLFDSHRRCFKGTARVDISRLVFDQSFKKQMDNQENIERFRRIMRIQGCQRLMQDCRVPVLIPAADWGSRVRLRRYEGSLDWLDVDIDYHLHAQDHETMITAARTRLGPTDQWWIVDVYVVEAAVQSGDATGSVQDMFIRSLQERYSNNRRPPDGLVYERIRRYEGYLEDQVNRFAANNWWVVLETMCGSKKAKYLRAFFKHPTLPQKLDQLLPIEGLWEGMRIGLLHKVLAMRCDQAIICYWDRIYQTFLDMVGGNRQHLRLIDGLTVRLIQSRVPKVSAKDFRFLKRELEEGNLFRTIPAIDRQAVWERLMEIDFPIPTLETFFKDRLYLEVARSVMQQLVVPDPNRRATIDERLYEQFDTHIPFTTSYRHESLKADLWEFWRFSFQYGFEMTEHQRRVSSFRGRHDSPTNTSQPLTEERAVLWQHFIRLVQQRGFRVPEHLNASANLSLSLPPLRQPRPVSLETEPEVPAKRRNGKPYTDSIFADHFALSAEALEQTWTFPRVTAGFLRQSVFFMFFCYLAGPRNGLNVQMLPENFQDFATPRGAVDEPDAPSLSSTVMAESTTARLPNSSYSLTTPQPLPMLPSSSQTSLAPTGYAVDVTVDDETRHLCLPHDLNTLFQFFQGLGEHYFHISNPADHERGMTADDCCGYYRENPHSRLHAVLMSRPYHPFSDDPMQGADFAPPAMETPELQDARNWLQSAIATLDQLNAASQSLFEGSSEI